MTKFLPHRTTVVPHQVSPYRASALRRLIVPGAALIWAILLGSTAAIAQPAPAGSGEPNWDAIRKGPLSVTDQSTVPKWLAAQIDAVFAAEDPAKPGFEFFKKIATQMRAPDADPRFKEAVGQALGTAFLARYQRGSAGGSVVKPLAPVFVLMALIKTGPPPATLPAFQAALTDPSPGVRCQAITGINVMLRATPPLPANVRNGLIEPIRKAALTETSPAVLSRCYDFLRFTGDVTGGGMELTTATAMISILDARLTRIEKQGEWPVVADAETVDWLAAKARIPALNTPQTQKDIARVAARLLADAAYACANLKPSEQIKQELERVVALAEDPPDPAAGLKDLFKAKVPNGTVPAPTVTESLASTAPDQKAKVNAAIAKWIGAEQTKGVLNDPFGLPIGLGIQRPAPTTSSAPAS